MSYSSFIRDDMQKIHIRMKNRLLPWMHVPVVKSKWQSQEHPSPDGKGKEESRRPQTLASRSCRNPGSWMQGSVLHTRKLRLREGKELITSHPASEQLSQESMPGLSDSAS